MTTHSKNDSVPAPTSASVERDAEMEALCEDYAAQLPGRITTIEQAWQDLLTDWNPDIARSWHMMVHQLAGSGASFGFPRVSAIGRAMEDQILALGEEYRRPSNEQRANISASLMALREAATKPKQVDTYENGGVLYQAAESRVNRVPTPARTCLPTGQHRLRRARTDLHDLAGERS